MRQAEARSSAGRAKLRAMVRTEAISVEERDAAKMVQYRGERINAIVAGNSNRYLIGGSCTRAGTWLATHELASMQGMGSGQPNISKRGRKFIARMI